MFILRYSVLGCEVNLIIHVHGNITPCSLGLRLVTGLDIKISFHLTYMFMLTLIYKPTTLGSNTFDEVYISNGFLCFKIYPGCIDCISVNNAL